MQPLRIQFAAIDAPETKLDRAIEVVLVALLAFCPAAFGAVHAWGELVFLAMVSGMATCLVVKSIGRADARFVWSRTYLPIVAFLLLIVIQSLPLPAAVISLISPQTAALKTRLLAGLWAGESTHWLTLTFYADATARQLRLVLAVATIFVVVVNVFQNVKSIRRLLIAMSLIGLAEAGLALAQDVTQSKEIYWSVAVYSDRALSGSFVNHSHFGQFMNLSIGAAIALMLLEWQLPAKRQGEMSLEGQPLISEVTSTLQQRATLILALITIVACAIALLLSLTRGGFISMLIAALFTLAMLGGKAPRRSRIVPAASLLVGAILLIVGMIGFQEIYHRLSSMTEISAANSRGQLLKDLQQAWKLFPIVGTGLGTFGAIFPMFDRSTLSAVATHAENEYAQTMTETGIAGLACVVALLWMVGGQYIGAIRGRFNSVSAIAIGLGYGLTAILIHSFSDFGQHIPANASLTAVCCALLVSLARVRRRKRDHDQPSAEYTANVRLRLAVGVMVAMACLLTIYTAIRPALAEHEWQIARQAETSLRGRDWQADNATFARLIIHAENAARFEPANYEYLYWLPFYRWQWISRQPDFATDPDYQRTARRIVDELHSARLVCPTSGLAASLAGQIEYFVLKDARGIEDIRLGSELNGDDPVAVFVDGELAASQGDWDRSLSRMKRYAAISPAGAVQAVEMYVQQFNRPELALQVATEDAAALDRLAEMLAANHAAQTIIDAATRQAGDLRLGQADQPDARFGELVSAAQIAANRQMHARSIDYLRRALKLDYTALNLRMILAKELSATGDRAGAVSQLQIFLQRNPDDVEAQKLMKSLSQ